LPGEDQNGGFLTDSSPSISFKSLANKKDFRDVQREENSKCVLHMYQVISNFKDAFSKLVTYLSSGGIKSFICHGE
jgi:hypothetical protein